MNHSTIKYIFAFCLLSLSEAVFVPLLAQNDSVLNRSVTVERDFQPVIQAAGKVSTRPAVVETVIEPAQVEYSDYTVDVNPGTTFNPLLSQPTRFQDGHPYHGYVRGALGHKNTLFDFGYHLNDGRNSILDVYAHHRAQWGLQADSKTTIGLTFTHTFSHCDLYFGLNGGNIFYHKYGHFYDYAAGDQGAWVKDKTIYPSSDFTDHDETSIWTAEAYLGVKANAKQDVQYRVQTGYKLFAKPGAVSEHQIRTHADFDWHSNAHHIGAVVYVQNNFLQLLSLSNDISDSTYNSRHNLRIEPYYAYSGERVQVHLGVNLDMNIGKGRNRVSGLENLTFAPSPHVNLEAQVAKKWLTVYADITGRHGFGTLDAFMKQNRYRLIHAGIVSHHPSSYVPIDAEAGLHIRPYRDLLIELHGGYALLFDQMTLIANTDSTSCHALGHALQAGDFCNTFSDYGRGKVGGQINYHYQDLVRVNIHGDYYFWNTLACEACKYTFDSPCAEILALNAGTNTTVYDHAKWELGVRVDGRIDQHWSLYSDNYFAGSRLALAKDGEHLLKPTIELDLGVQYEMWVGKSAKAIENDKGTVVRPLPQSNLVLFFQLNNWLHRKNDIYYGYRSQGINFLAGVTFRF